MNDNATQAKYGLELILFKLAVVNLARMEAFYSDTLGLGVVNRLDNDVMVETMLGVPGKSPSIVLLQWKDDRKIVIGNGYGPVVFFGAGVDELYARAMEAGATSVAEPSGVMGGRIAFVKDPEGHDIEFVSLPRSDSGA